MKKTISIKMMIVAGKEYTSLHGILSAECKMVVSVSIFNRT